jgi:hypothetical protein
VATGIDNPDPTCQTQLADSLLTELAGRLRNDGRHIAGRIERNAPLPPQLDTSAGLPAGPPPARRPANPNSEYARDAAPQGLDPYGRSARNIIDENVLDIPAFLRRKAS